MYDALWTNATVLLSLMLKAEADLYECLRLWKRKLIDLLQLWESVFLFYKSN